MEAFTLGFLQGRAKKASWASPDSICEGLEALLDASWDPLDRLLCALGRLLGPLGRFLGASWALLGRSWTSLDWSTALFGYNLPPRDAPGLDFTGFGDVLNWVLEGFESMFCHVFCCVSRFDT